LRSVQAAQWIERLPREQENPKTKRITAQHVATRAGVSISAVSRTYTPGASVSPATRKKILAAAETLGYQPNVMARSLMTGRTELIGLVSNNFDNPAFMEIFDLFTRKLQEHGLRPLLVNLSGLPGPEEAVSMLRQYSVDAVIVASSTVSADFIAGCNAAGIPVIHAFGKAARQSSVQVVGADNRQGGRLAAEVLLSRGYRHIAFLGGPQQATSTIERLKGFESGLQVGGTAPVTKVFAASYFHEGGRQMMAALLQGNKIDAVFCGDDILAIGALDACKDHGRRVPQDIGILGFNDIAMASWPAYNVSTIRQPIAEIIVASVDRAIKVVSGEEDDTSGRPFPCEVVLRGTLRAR